MNGQKFYRFLQYSFISVAAFFLLFLSVLPHPVFVTLKITPAIIAIITVFFLWQPKEEISSDPHLFFHGRR